MKSRIISVDLAKDVFELAIANAVSSNAIAYRALSSHACSSSTRPPWS